MSDPDPITSTRNPIVRRFRLAAAGDPPELLLADGQKLVRDALDAKLPITEAAVSPRLLASEAGRDLKRRLERDAGRVHDCSDELLARLSQLTTPQGVVAIVRRPAYALEDLAPPGSVPLIVVAAGVRDPGNLGALVRTAESAFATGLIALAGSADPFRDKAVRGSAGSVFRLPTLGGVTLDAFAAFARAHRLQIVAAESEGGTDPWDTDLRGPLALLVGAEGAGLPPQAAAIAARRVRIPMAPGVESLNVAVAAGVLLYEARRQRR
jgi:TrmH family RNA methyltransferase